jgi:hypothetical protein
MQLGSGQWQENPRWRAARCKNKQDAGRYMAVLWEQGIAAPPWVPSQHSSPRFQLTASQQVQLPWNCHSSRVVFSCQKSDCVIQASPLGAPSLAFRNLGQAPRSYLGSSLFSLKFPSSMFSLDSFATHSLIETSLLVCLSSMSYIYFLLLAIRNSQLLW